MCRNKLFVSQNIVVDNSILNGGILVDEEGKIRKILRRDFLELYYADGAEVNNLKNTEPYKTKSH